MVLVVSSGVVLIILVDIMSLLNCVSQVCGGLPCFLLMGLRASSRLQKWNHGPPPSSVGD